MVLRSYLHFGLLGLVLSLSLGGLGCGRRLSESCAVSQDQLDSFLPTLDSAPVRVMMDLDFTAEQRVRIFEAVNTWNTWSKRTFGKTLFIASVTPTAFPYSSAESGSCSGRSGDPKSVAIVHEEDSGTWEGMGLKKNIPAATVRCTAGERLVDQVMVVNPALVDQRQIQSIALHELGHVIGLDHSCMDGAGTGNYKGCSSLDEDHPYRSASMFPVLRGPSVMWGGPELKEGLKENDTVRANCVLGMLSGSP
jgi:hypothetical protein